MTSGSVDGVNRSCVGPEVRDYRGIKNIQNELKDMKREYMGLRVQDSRLSTTLAWAH
jgi:hypothetical protein